MTTIILAKILGLYFLTLGLAFMLNPDRFKRMYQQIKKDENSLLLSAILALLVGVVIIGVHNIWILDWPVIITVVGWWSLIKGFTLLAYPNAINYFSSIDNKSITFYRLISLAYILLGLFLAYKGWAGDLYF